MYFGDISIAIQFHCKSAEHALILYWWQLRLYYPLLLVNLKHSNGIPSKLVVSYGIIIVCFKISNHSLRIWHHYSHPQHTLI